jgi:hypothetical protein
MLHFTFGLREEERLMSLVSFVYIYKLHSHIGGFTFCNLFLYTLMNHCIYFKTTKLVQVS